MRPLLLATLTLCAAAAAAAAAEGVLPPCFEEFRSDFVIVREFLVLDAFTEMPSSVSGDALPMAEYQKALGTTEVPFTLSSEMTDAWIIRVDPKRWIVATVNRTYVRRSAVTAIDERPGMLHYAPPTPAVPGGAKVLAQPISRGVTVVAGSGRIFCGVRSQAKTLAVVSRDLDVLAQRVAAPNARSLTEFIAAED